MKFITLIFIGLGLAMDALAISISNGISKKNFSIKDSIRQSFYFGGFQFIMPLIGWGLGTNIRQYIEVFDHWIAFILLLIIGVNMIKECFDEDIQDYEVYYIDRKTIIIQAIATSIDALAIGISIAILNVNIIYASSIIGVIAFIFSFFGGIIGNSIGDILNKKAEIIGGIILIIIGIKILLEHTIFNFT